MTDYAKLGTHTLLQRAARKEGKHARDLHAYTQGARPGHPVVGWTPPTVIYDKMRHIDVGAKELNQLILVNVTSDSLRTAWQAWYARWNAFFDKYQGTFAKLGAIFYTDDLAVQTEDYRRVYESFRLTYTAQRRAGNEPLPPPSSPVPGPLAPGDTKKEGQQKEEGWSLPWWIWAVGGVGVTVGGYFAYKAIRNMVAEAKAKRRAIEGVLPDMLSGYGVPPRLTAAGLTHAPETANDPSRQLAPSGLLMDVAPPPPPAVRVRIVHVPHEAVRHTRHHRDMDTDTDFDDSALSGDIDEES